MLFLEEIHLEGEDGEELIDIALDVLNAIFLPGPNLRRNIVIDRNICLHFYIFSNLQVEAWIIDKNHTIGLPFGDIELTHLHVPKNRRKVQQYGNEAHISQLTIMFDAGTTNGCHQIAAKETELCVGVNFFQRLHQVGCMKVARGLACYEIVFH